MEEYQTVLRKYIRNPARVISTVLFIVVVGLLLILSWGQAPIHGIAGDSMEPTYSQGDAIIVQSVDPNQIEEGDIIVFTAPSSAQFQYDYPETVVHRVTKVDRSNGQLSFQPAGDNSGEDPFEIYPRHIQGTPIVHIPYFGYVLLYLQSIQGRIFIGITVLVYLSYYTFPKLRRDLENYVEELVTPDTTVASEHGKIVQRLDRMDNSMGEVDRALTQFAEAMELYATHLESHTHAVQEMGEAASDIKTSVERQSSVLDRLERHVSVDYSPRKTNNEDSNKNEDAQLGLEPDDDNELSTVPGLDNLPTEFSDIVPNSIEVEDSQFISVESDKDVRSEPDIPINPDPETLLTGNETEKETPSLFAEEKNDSTSEDDQQHN